MSSSGFSGFVWNSQGAERGCFRLLGCIAVDIIPLGDLKIYEPCCFNFLLQQSAGDSTRQEIAIVLGAIRHLFLYQDVSDNEDNFFFVGLDRLRLFHPR